MRIRRLLVTLAVAMTVSAGLAATMAAAPWPTVPTIEYCGLNRLGGWRALHLGYWTGCSFHYQEPLPPGYVAKVIFTKQETGEIVTVPLEKTILRYGGEIMVTPGMWSAALWLQTPDGAFTEGPAFGPVPVSALALGQRPMAAHVGYGGYYQDDLRAGASTFYVPFSQPVSGVSATTVKLLGPSGAQIPVKVSYDPATWDAKVTIRDWSKFTKGATYRITVSGAIKNSKGKKLVPFDMEKTAL